MSKKSHLNLQGFHYNEEEGFSKKHLEIKLPFGPNDERQGRPISKSAAQKLIHNFQKNVTDKNQVVAIDYDREILSMILAQRGCEGIRCYFAKVNDKEETGQRPTLVLVGLDKDNNPLNFKNNFTWIEEQKKQPEFRETENYHQLSSRESKRDGEESENVASLIVEVGGPIEIDL